MPRRCEPVTLRSAALAVLTRQIEFHVRILFGCRRVNVYEMLGFFQRVVLYLPSQLVTELAPKALKCADGLAERRPLSEDILLLLVQVFIPESTTSFPTASLNTYQVRRAVVSRICDLRFLRVYYNLEHFHENVHTLATLQELKSLSSLTEIYLPHWFTDQIAHLLGQSCQNLQLLDAANSRSMTDESVESLTRCKNLKVLIASSTRLSENGYIELLTKLSYLQKIGYCCSLNAVVASVGESRGPINAPLSLTEYESDEAPDRNTLSMCPDLSTVIFDDDLSRPTELPRKVAKLLVQGTKFRYTNNSPSRILIMLNSNIVHLELVGCEVTEALVESIASLCVNLRHLRLYYKLLHNLKLRTKEREPFGRLETLDITNSRLALDILAVARNIRFFNSEPRTLRTDNDLRWTSRMFQEVRNKNPMEHLESFLVSSICLSSVDGIMNFVRACSKLRIIGSVQEWNLDQISETYYEQICQAVKNENMDLTFV